MRGSTSALTCSPLTVMFTCIANSFPLCSRTARPRCAVCGWSSSEARCRLYSAVPRMSVTGSQASRGAPARLGECLLGSRLAGQRRRKLNQCGTVRIDRGQAHPGGGNRVAIERDRRAGRRDRPVADPPFDLRVGTGGVVPHRNPDLDQHLVVAPRRSRTGRGGSRRSRSRAHPTVPAPGTPHPAPRTRSSDPRLDRPGTANRRACRGCAPPDRRSPVRHRGRSGTPRPGSSDSSSSVPGHGADPNQGRIGDHVSQLEPRSLMSIRYRGWRCAASSSAAGCARPRQPARLPPTDRVARSAWSTLVARSYSNGPGTCM